MTTDELSRMFAAERAARPPAQALENGLPRFLSDVAGQVAPLPIATGALKVGWSVASKWIAIGFVVGLGGAGAAATWGPSGVATSTPTPPATVSGQLVAATVATGDWGTEIGLDEARPEQPPAAASAGGSSQPCPHCEAYWGSRRHDVRRRAPADRRRQARARSGPAPAGHRLARRARAALSKWRVCARPRSPTHLVGVPPRQEPSVGASIRNTPSRLADARATAPCVRSGPGFGAIRRIIK
jgi:hypothetical protein